MCNIVIISIIFLFIELVVLTVELCFLVCVLSLEFEIDDEDKGCSLLTPIGFDSKDEVESPSPISFSHSVMKSLEEDTLYPC